MKIQLLYFDGCPSWEHGLQNLQAALQEEGLDASVELIKVESDEDAGRMKFPGSPTFRVDGRDLWPDQREAYSLSCRVYPTPDGLKGYPTIAMFKNALKQQRQV
jgi:hypothetical protein